MRHYDRGLIVIFILALFSLASLQALNLLVKLSGSQVLGESTISQPTIMPCQEINRLQKTYCAAPTP